VFQVHVIISLTIKLDTLSGGLSGASASATNCGPRAEPPIPIDSI